MIVNAILGPRAGRRTLGGAPWRRPGMFSPRSNGWIHLGVLLAWASAAEIPTAEAAKPPRIAVVFTAHPAYRDATSSIETILKDEHYSCVLIELPGSSAVSATRDDAKSPATEQAPASSATGTSRPTATTTSPASPPIDEALKQLADARPTVIVTVGIRATSFVIDTIPKTPVIFCMVPNALDMPSMVSGHPNRSRVAGVATDVSPAQQVAWMASVHPGCKKIGVLCSLRSKLTAEAVRAAAKARGITVLPIPSRKDEFPRAIEALNARGCDGVLMIADASVYNRANIHRLLLWGVRQKKCVWTFSANIVKAGAFAGVYTETDHIAEQTAKRVKEVIAGRNVSKIGLYYVYHFNSAINKRTAEMIGVPLTRQTLEQATLRFGTNE